MSPKNRTLKKLQRKKQTKELRYSVLIVCEGEITEPTYFEALTLEYRLAAEVKVTPSSGSAPISVVDYAIKLKKERSRDFRRGVATSEYESVWCVFDVESRGNNPTFLSAVNKAQGNQIDLAISNICFEYWLLLHFEFTSLHASKGDDYDSHLDRHLGKYDKTNLGQIRQIALNVDVAVERAEDLEKSVPWSFPVWNSCSSTSVHNLCKKLKSKKK